MSIENQFTLESTPASPSFPRDGELDEFSKKEDVKKMTDGKYLLYSSTRLLSLWGSQMNSLLRCSAKAKGETFMVQWLRVEGTNRVEAVPYKK